LGKRRRNFGLKEGGKYVCIKGRAGTRRGEEGTSGFGEKKLLLKRRGNQGKNPLGCVSGHVIDNLLAAKECSWGGKEGMNKSHKNTCWWGNTGQE